MAAASDMEPEMMPHELPYFLAGECAINPGLQSSNSKKEDDCCSVFISY